MVASSKLTVKTQAGQNSLERAIRIGQIKMDQMINSLYDHPELVNQNAQVRRGYVLENLYIEHKYKGYLEREQRSIKRMNREAAMKIPQNLDFDGGDGLANEARASLSQHKPKTIGQARSLYGVTPSDILVLLRHISKVQRDLSRQNSQPH